MEEAKLSVRVTKKRKIVADLESVGGKKMPSPGLKLEDTALDGAGVGVERERGQIVLIKMD